MIKKLSITLGLFRLLAAAKTEMIELTPRPVVSCAEIAKRCQHLVIGTIHEEGFLGTRDTKKGIEYLKRAQALKEKKKK